MPDGEGFRMLQLLLRRVCDVNAVNDRRHTPLLLALLQRDRRSAEMLMHYGSDPNSMDADGNTPLILASQTGDDNLVSVFLARGAHVNLVSSCRQRTALHYAVEAGVSNIVRFLLRHGADVYIRDNMGDTPLSLASGNLLDLIRACAAVQAAESGDSDRLSELYRDGLDINAVHLASKSPLLHHAACAGQPDVVHFLLRSGAFVNEPNSEGNTALHYACVSELPHRNYAETLRQLLNSGADINARNDRGDTPLHLAAERGYNLRVSMLLKTAGAHQLIANKRGELALHKACCNNQALMSVFILMEGLQTACLNRPCDGGWTPLMFACKSNALDIVSYLLDECSADVNATQTEGYTALHIAVQSRHDEIRRQLCKKLIAHKANPNVPAGSKKLTPLHFVCAKGIEDICLLFAEHGGDLLQPDAEGDSALSMIPADIPQFKLRLQEFTKDCPDEELLKSWTCQPRKNSPAQITMTTAPQGDCQYDSLPSHSELASSSSIGIASVGAGGGGGALPAASLSSGAGDGGQSVDMPRLHLSQTARQVARRIFGNHGEHGGSSGSMPSNPEDSVEVAPSDYDAPAAGAYTGAADSVSNLQPRQMSDAHVSLPSLSSAGRMRVAYTRSHGKNSSAEDTFRSVDSSRTRTIKGDVDVAVASIGGDSLRHVTTADDDTLRLQQQQNNALGRYDTSDAIRNLFMGMQDLSKQIRVPGLEGNDDSLDAIASTTGLTQIPLCELHKESDLGSGSYSDVYRSTYLGKPVAVKLFRNMTGDEVMRIFQQEVIMLSKMRHPNVLTIIGYCQDIDGHAIVTDLLERGSLQDVLHDATLDLSWKRRIEMLQHASLGMQYLHKCQLLHRDLKSGNLLVGANFNVQVADFGMTKVRQHTVTMTTNFRGTPAYIAPETFDTKSHSEASDVYAFGIIMFEVASRKTPYHEHRHLRLMELMMSVLRGTRPGLTAAIMAANGCPSDDYMELMQQCWHEDFRQRPNFTEIISALRRMPDISSSVGAASTPVTP
ncbi:ankyrin repeat domain-containing protein 50-like [Sycon ciliatum]|uniref:ankyrin repeat domain-containing protein 50-like n=1 Tax=Sycon ciliatum TaxID=27933 RepID=UPI0031F68CD6